MGNVDSQGVPEIYGNAVLEIGVDLTDCIGNAELPSKALELVKLLPGVSNLPTVKVNHAERSVRLQDQVARMEISVLINGLLPPDLVDILPDEANRRLVSRKSNIRRFIGSELPQFFFNFCPGGKIRRINRDSMKLPQNCPCLAAKTVLLRLRQIRKDTLKIFALHPGQEDENCLLTQAEGQRPRHRNANRSKFPNDFILLFLKLKSVCISQAQQTVLPIQRPNLVFLVAGPAPVDSRQSFPIQLRQFFHDLLHKHNVHPSFRRSAVAGSNSVRILRSASKRQRAPMGKILIGSA